MKTSDSAPGPNTGAASQHITAAIQSHRRKIQALTIAAFVLGFLVVAASITIVVLNELYVRPRQEKLAKESGALAWPAAATVAESPHLQPDAVQVRMLALEIDMMRVVSMGSMLVAGSVGLLGIGTLALVAAVMLNRRATLQQVNASLMQISEQLRELRPG